MAIISKMLYLNYRLKLSKNIFLFCNAPITTLYTLNKNLRILRLNIPHFAIDCLKMINYFAGKGLT